MKGEADEERKFVRWAANENLMALKMGTSVLRGLPDRIVIGPGAKILFLEFKSSKGKTRRFQDYIHGKLQRLGFKVFVVRSSEEAIKECRRVFGEV